MHFIRLRGPWELFLPGSDRPLRIEMPATWGTLISVATAASPLPSPARLVRRFGKPTGLSPQDRLHLVIECTSADFQLELNGQELSNLVSSVGSFSWEVTPLVNPRNELVILLPIPSPKKKPGDTSLPLRDVRLEISAEEE